MVLIESHADSRGVDKHRVDLLKSTSRGLHAEEVCQGDEGCADDGPDPEVVSTDGGQADGSYHDHDEVGHPVREDADGCGLVADAEGLDFGGVGPGDWEDLWRRLANV